MKYKYVFQKTHNTNSGKYLFINICTYNIQVKIAGYNSGIQKRKHKEIHIENLAPNQSVRGQ